VIRYMPATSVFERADGDKHVQSGVTFSMSKRADLAVARRGPQRT